MFINLFVCILFSFLVSVSSVLDRTYEICTTPENKTGKCVLISSCPLLYNLLKEKPVPEPHIKRLKKLQCGFQGIHPKVCCDNISDDSVITPVPTHPPEVHDELHNLLPNTTDCGFFIEDRATEVTLLDSYPWMALLEYETPKGRAIHCGGALINQRYVLTAAHCVAPGNLDKNWKLINVRLGEYDTRTNPDCDEFLFNTYNCCCATPALNIGVKQVIIHQDYDSSDVNRYSDIALIRMNHTVEYTEFVRPVCLQPLSLYADKLNPGKSTIIGGWGYTDHGYNSVQKLSTKLNIRTNEECAAIYSYVGITVRDDQLCAFPRKGGDSCAGDSGGILMNDNHETITSLNYFALGVMSIANQRCSAKDYPIIYTRIPNYKSWIIKNLRV